MIDTIEPNDVPYRRYGKKKAKDLTPRQLAQRIAAQQARVDWWKASLYRSIANRCGGWSDLAVDALAHERVKLDKLLALAAEDRER